MAILTYTKGTEGNSNREAHAEVGAEVKKAMATAEAKEREEKRSCKIIAWGLRVHKCLQC